MQDYVDNYKTRDMNNRKHNALNAAQTNRLKVLTVCSAGLLRSPTAAWVLSNDPFNFNTRAAGSNPGYALICVDEVLLHWADVVVFVNEENYSETMWRFQSSMKRHEEEDSIIVLDIEDDYQFRNPELVKQLTEQLKDKMFRFMQPGSSND